MLKITLFLPFTARASPHADTRFWTLSKMLHLPGPIRMNGWWDRHVMPRLIGCACTQPAVMRDRAKVVPRASGRHSGTGLRRRNQSAVLRLVAMCILYRALIPRRNCLAARKLRSCDRKAEAPTSQTALQRRFRLKTAALILSSPLSHYVRFKIRPPRFRRSGASCVPGGRLIFLEHGKAPEPAAANWQNRIEPVWKHIAGGCHLTRPVTGAISDAGFVCDAPQGHYMKRTPKWLGWVEWGEATLAR